MARKEIAKIIKVNLKGGAASPAPPLGPALSAAGVQVMDFVRTFNDATRPRAEELLPTEIFIYKDKSWEYKIKTPITSILVKKELGLEKGSAEPNRIRVSTLSREQQFLHRMREELVHCRTKLINGARGWLRTRLIRIPTGNPCTFPRRVRTAALATPHGVPDYLDRNLTVIERLTEQIDAADKDLEERVGESELCRRLKTYRSQLRLQHHVVRSFF